METQIENKRFAIPEVWANTGAPWKTGFPIKWRHKGTSKMELFSWKHRKQIY